MAIVCGGCDVVPGAGGLATAALCVEAEQLHEVENVQARINETLLDIVKALHDAGLLDRLRRGVMAVVNLASTTDFASLVLRCALLDPESRRRDSMCSMFVETSSTIRDVVTTMRSIVESRFPEGRWGAALFILAQLYVFGTSRELERYVTDYVLAYSAASILVARLKDHARTVITNLQTYLQSLLGGHRM